MKNLEKNAIAALIVGAGLLVIELFLCMIALVCPAIGANVDYANTVVGILLTALGIIVIAMVMGIAKIIHSLYH
jgi:hypothetical protein